jgi:tetratricopeptide (TPR) repeat protein
VLVAYACCSSLNSAIPVQSSGSRARLHAEKGIQSARSGNLPVAEMQLREAVKLGPDDPFCLATLGSILGMQNKLQEAASYFEKAVKLDPGNVEVRRNLAATQFQLGKGPEARKNLEMILISKPSDPVTLLMAGMVAENLKDYAGAANWLSKVPQLVDQRPEAQLALARSYYKLGQQEHARKTLQRIPAMDFHSLFLAAQEASAAKDYATAESLFLSVGPSYSDKASVGYGLAQAQYEAGRYAQAEKTLNDLITQRTTSGSIYNLLGWSYYRQGKTEEAALALKQAIGMEPLREEHCLDLARILAENPRRLKGALQVVDTALQRFPTSHRLYQTKGQIQFQLHYYRDAVESYARAGKLNAFAPDAKVGLATAQWAAGLHEEAITTFEDGLLKFPRDPQYLQEYGRVLLEKAKLGDPAAEGKAVVLLKKVIALDDSQFEPFYQLGNLTLEKGHLQEAVELLKRAAALDPASDKVHFALSRGYRRLGRQEEADREFEFYQKLKEERVVSPDEGQRRE